MYVCIELPIELHGICTHHKGINPNPSGSVGCNNMYFPQQKFLATGLHAVKCVLIKTHDSESQGQEEITIITRNKNT